MTDGTDPNRYYGVAGTYLGMRHGFHLIRPDGSDGEPMYPPDSVHGSARVHLNPRSAG